MPLLSQQQIELTICKHIYDHFAPLVPITPTTKLMELGMDSLDHVELTMDLEHLYNINIESEETETCETVHDLARLIYSKI